MEFNSTKFEITRRIRAFITLSAFILCGMFLFSLFFSYSINWFVYVLVTGILAAIFFIAFYFLQSLKHTKIFIVNNQLTRKTLRFSDNIFLPDIKKIIVKRRSIGSIREIYLYPKKGRVFTITAMESDFEHILSLLEAGVGDQATIILRKEPINFDHWLFYPLLGLAISFVTVLFLKILENLDYQSLGFLMYGFCGYTLALAIYFYLAKPIASRQGKKHILSDYALTIIMVCLAVISFIFGIKTI